jgi:DNA-damage-inducible protein D
MDKQIVIRLHSSFEDMVRRHADSGVEYWCARDLQMLLGYTEWRNFAKVIDKAITACQTAGYDPKDHFVDINKMVTLGGGAQRQVADIAFTPCALVSPVALAV